MKNKIVFAVLILALLPVLTTCSKSSSEYPEGYLGSSLIINNMQVTALDPPDLLELDKACMKKSLRLTYLTTFTGSEFPINNVFSPATVEINTNGKLNIKLGKPLDSRTMELWDFWGGKTGSEWLALKAANPDVEGDTKIFTIFNFYEKDVDLNMSFGGPLESFMGYPPLGTKEDLYIFRMPLSMSMPKMVIYIWVSNSFRIKHTNTSGEWDLDLKAGWNTMIFNFNDDSTISGKPGEEYKCFITTDLLS